jgi:hypothetical protein
MLTSLQACALIAYHVSAEDSGELAVKALLLHADTSLARGFGKPQDGRAESRIKLSKVRTA